MTGKSTFIHLNTFFFKVSRKKYTCVVVIFRSLIQPLDILSWNKEVLSSGTVLTFERRLTSSLFSRFSECKLCGAFSPQTVGLFPMPRHETLGYQHSMKSPCSLVTRHNVSKPSRTARSPISSQSHRSYVFLLGLLFCVFTWPQCTEAAFTCSSQCTCVPWMLGGVKYQNVTCSGSNLTSVPKDGKEGSDVFRL